MLVDGSGKEVVLKGVNWFGFNTGCVERWGGDAGAEREPSNHRPPIVQPSPPHPPFPSLDAVGNFTNGPDAVSQDYRVVLWRIRQLGFNAVRVPFVFRDAGWPTRPSYNYTRPCGVPSATDIKTSSVLPPRVPPRLRRARGRLPAEDPPLPPPLDDGSGKGLCNADMPNDLRARFLWTVKAMVDDGFYVMLDYHPGKRWGGGGGNGGEKRVFG